MLIGGFTGFALTFAAGMLASNEPCSVLLTAGIGCIVGAFLMRWFRHIYTNCLRSVVIEKAKAVNNEEKPA